MPGAIGLDVHVHEADFGQPNLYTSESGLALIKLDAPQFALVDASGRLWVSDSQNNRILRWDNADTAASGTAAAQVLGQTGFTTRTGTITACGLNSFVNATNAR